MIRPHNYEKGIRMAKYQQGDIVQDRDGFAARRYEVLAVGKESYFFRNLSLALGSVEPLECAWGFRGMDAITELVESGSGSERERAIAEAVVLLRDSKMPVSAMLVEGLLQGQAAPREFGVEYAEAGQQELRPGDSVVSVQKGTSRRGLRITVRRFVEKP